MTSRSAFSVSYLQREITYEQVMQLATAESLENWTKKK